MFRKKLAYSFSCLMANLPKLLANKVKGYAASIPDEFIYESNDGELGRERNPHITLKYGLHTTDLKDIMEVLDGQGPLRARLGRVTSFWTERSIVLKVSVQSEDLVALNKKICRELDYTDAYPEYRPHVTIAYLRKNDRSPYYFQDYFHDDLDGTEVVLDKLTFAVPGHKKYPIDLISMDSLADELMGIASVLEK